jgi:hypothetical protein
VSDRSAITPVKKWLLIVSMSLFMATMLGLGGPMLIPALGWPAGAIGCPSGTMPRVTTQHSQPYGSSPSGESFEWRVFCDEGAKTSSGSLDPDTAHLITGSVCLPICVLLLWGIGRAIRSIFARAL